MPGVQVTFGANIQGIVDGIDSIRGMLGGLAATLGTAFSVEALENFVATMAEVGEQVERSAAMLGVSTASVQELGFIAKVTGGDAQGLALAMERLQVNLQKAQSGTGPAAEALKALGLNAKALLAVPIDEQMNHIADAVSRFADGGNKTAIVMELMGRSGAQMIPVLDKGRDGLDELREASLSSASIMTSQTITALASVKEKTTILHASIEALGGTLVALSSGPLNSFAAGLTETSGHLTALASTGNLAEYTLGYLDEVVDNLGFRFVALGHAIGNLSTLNFAHLASDWARDEAALLANAKTEGADLDAILNRSIDSYKKLIAATNQADNRPQAPESGAPNKDALKASMEQYQSQIKVADEAFRQTQEHLGAEAKLHEMTYSQETAALLAALDVRRAAEMNATDGELSLYARGTAGYEKVLATRKEEDAKYFADRQKIVDQAAQREAQEWQKAADQIAGAFNSQLKGLLAGTTTWSKAMKNISADLVLKFIEDQIKLTLEFLANQARMLAAKLAAETGMTTATTAGAALRSAAEVASGQASIFAVIADALKSIYASGGKAGAAVAAEVAPEAGPAAPAIGAAAGAAVIAVGTGLASFDIGTDYVLRSGLAMIHQGEQIKPAAGSGPYTGKAGGGGDQHLHFNIVTQNPRDMARALMDNNSAVMKAVQRAVKNGAHLAGR